MCSVQSRVESLSNVLLFCVIVAAVDPLCSHKISTPIIHFVVDGLLSF